MAKKQEKQSGALLVRMKKLLEDFVKRLAKLGEKSIKERDSLKESEKKPPRHPPS